MASKNEQNICLNIKKFWWGLNKLIIKYVTCYFITNFIYLILKCPNQPKALPSQLQWTLMILTNLIGGFKHLFPITKTLNTFNFWNIKTRC